MTSAYRARIGKLITSLMNSERMEMLWYDTYAPTQHLAEAARHVADDAHAILIMDGRLAKY